MPSLTNRITPAGWLIGDPVSFAPDHTGGYFSHCYYVSKDGKQAFLKALDIEKFGIGELFDVLSGFQYESDLLSICKDKRLTRVVQVIEADKIESDPAAPPVLRYVPFLIFELAVGDIRQSVDISKTVTDQWRFYVLHQTTLALLQLHGQSIAHQDVKPSNVLVFQNAELKLGDLGRSSMQGRPAPHDRFMRPGALNYAPFEQRYGDVATDWIERRLSSDVFHLGCLVVFAFTNICFPEYVMNKLDEVYQPGKWGEPYTKVVPHIQHAFSLAIHDISKDFPEQFRSDLVSIILDLCHPEPARRGQSNRPAGSSVGRLWLQRYASKFDLMEKAARVRKPTTNV